MDKGKYIFLKDEFIPLVRTLPPGKVGKWGKMNAQQMVEHVTDFFKVSTGRIEIPLVTPEEQLPKFKAFLQSDKEFRENTKAPVLPDDPFPTRHDQILQAVDELQNEAAYFFEYFDKDTEKKTTHPVFGELNFEEWVLLHYKHVIHHLKQFELK